MFLSWIIPAYNEEKRIEKSLREVDAYLRSRLAAGEIPSYEIIVSNSASTDRTAEVVRELISRMPNLRVLNLENRGKGWAVKRGILEASGDIRLFSDADNSTAPEYFDKMIPFFRRGYEVVISSRDSKDAPGASRDVKEPLYRELLGNLGNLVIQVIGGVWGIWDTQNGFKALTAKAAGNLFPQIAMTGFSFDIEMLALSRRFGFRIGVIPVQWRFDADSRVTPADYIRVLGDVFRIRWNLLTGKYEYVKQVK